MQEIWQIVRSVTPADIFDIVLVAFPFYVIFALLREARSHFALWGIVSMLLASLLLFLIARVANLQASILIFERFWIIVVLMFLIIFQNELKRALADVGRLRIFRGLFQQKTQVIGEIVNAVATMAERRVGALIAIERGNPLNPYLPTGTKIDAVVSSEAIGAVFTPYSPLHDGALIVSGERIVAASCILPLTDNPTLSKDLGTRHRAGIGLTEETDALTVVVSEETGSISLCKEGTIERFLKPEELRRRLERELDIESEEETGEE